MEREMGKLVVRETAPERLFTVEALEQQVREGTQTDRGRGGMTAAQLAHFKQARRQEFATLHSAVGGR